MGLRIATPVTSVTGSQWHIARNAVGRADVSIGPAHRAPCHAPSPNPPPIFSLSAFLSSKPTVSLIPPLLGPWGSISFSLPFGCLKFFIIMLKLCKIFLHSKKVRFPNGFSEFPLAEQINKVYYFINGFFTYFFFYCQQINGKWCYSLSIGF